MHIDRYKAELVKRLAEAERQGLRAVGINAGDVHQSVENGSGANRMPICCAAMYALQKTGDKVVYSPPKGRAPH